MPPRKKQTQQQQHQRSSQPEEQPAPIARILECDDILGKIYSSCDMDAKYALRASCRACYSSPVINSFISTFNIDEGTDPEVAASALAAFPKLAKMKGLHIWENDLNCIFSYLLGPAPEASAARDKLQCVDKLQLHDCSFDTLSATAIHVLFPVMRSNHGYFQLDGFCSVTRGAHGILAAQTRINEMELDCDCLSTPGALLELGSFKSLKSLVLIGGVNQVGLSIEPLCRSMTFAGTQLQLTKLKLGYLRDVIGLDVCLAHHPLQELQLVGVVFPVSLLSKRLASSTLKVMHLNVNLTFPVISAANFPALQHLEIGSLDLKQVPGISAEESVQRCICLASGIAGLPSVRITNKDADGDDEVALRGDGWPGAQLVELIDKGLAPLRAAFQSVKDVNILEANVGSGAVRAIASLKPGLEILRLCTHEGVPLHTYSDEYGLSDAVSLLPHLKYLEIVCESPPRDIFRVLTKRRQDFVLQLVATNDECLQRLQDIRLQWDTGYRRKRRPPVTTIDC